MTRRVVVAGAVVALLAAGLLAYARRPVEAVVEPRDPCDGGDEAWARQVIPFLYGRLPRGVSETRAVGDLATTLGRGPTVRLLARGPEYEGRWSDWLLDETQVNRAGHKAHRECFDTPLAPEDDGALAARLRSDDPQAAFPETPFNMADVLRSTLRLDDLTPYYRARLFSLLARPLWFCRNIPELDNEIGRRRNIGDLFSKIYLHRNVDCLACHNSEYSTTTSDDPAQNRFFAVPGQFERSLFGARRGGEPGSMFQPFRYYDVVTSPDPTAPPKWRRPAPTDPRQLLRPWGLDAACGTFAARETVPDDPAGFEGHLGGDLGRKGTIWDVERLLAKGVDALKARGGIVSTAETEPTAPEAMASMLALRIAHQVWLEAFGTPLTVAHFFPRTEAQRATLQSLADGLVRSGWSLRELLVAVATHPQFSPAPPGAGCGAAYDDPVIFNAWSREEQDPQRKGNDQGDTLHRADARELVKALSAAMEWPAPARFPSSFEEQVFLERAGAYVSDGNAGSEGVSFQGLLAWESRYGACEQPVSRVKEDPPGAGRDTSTCVNRCGRGGEGDRNAEACWCDATCHMHGDCCADFAATCTVPVTERPPDFIDRVAARLSEQPQATVRDAALVLKDRLVAEPVLPDEEAALVASLFGAASPEALLSSTPEWKKGARRYCGVLAKSPAFLLRRVPPVSLPETVGALLPEQGYEPACEALRPAVESAGLSLSCGARPLRVYKRIL